ncbi:MAG: protein kinase [Thermoanaerobaculia bacterium]
MESDDMIGTTLSHYKILDKLGEGGMGTVYLAEDTSLHRKVALKMLPAEMAADQERLDSFQREARAVATLNHPGIVTIYSVEESDQGHFITMELVEGENLDDRLGKGGLNLEEFFKVAIPIADALTTAHNRGITHRDLKPANIMLTAEGRVKILDFGLAKLHATLGSEAEDPELPTQALTREGMVMGTVPYMSPEQVQGLPVDHRTDIFSLGVIFYELMSGDRPFTGATSAQLVSSILRDDPPPVTKVKIDLPNHLGRIIGRCLEKEVDRRYQTALDLRNELEQLQKETSRDEATKGSSIAVLPFVNMSPDKDQDYFCEGIAEELINGLGRIQNLRVASRTSTFQFRGSESDIREIGEKLAVTTVLEGSVRKAGERLRITAQLVNVEDGYRLWSNRYDRDLKDVFAIQDEIAENIVEALRVTLSPKERRAIQHVATRDVNAFDYYLRGRQFFYQMDRRRYELARQMYSRAIEIDPAYALAYAGIADCASFLFMYADSSEANQQQAIEASQKALELDPELAEAHASRGLALSLSKKYDEATEEFETAIRLNPKLFEAYYFFGRACLAQGDYAQAVGLFEKAAGVRPEDYQAPHFKCQALEGLGASEEELTTLNRQALELIKRHVEANPEDLRALCLGATAFVRDGQTEQGLEWARRALAVDSEEPLILYNVACVYSLSGMVEETIDLLEKAIKAGFGDTAWLDHDSDLDPVREHPRFQVLLETLKPKS